MNLRRLALTIRAAIAAGGLALGLMACGGEGEGTSTAEDSATAGDEDVKVTEPETEVEVVGPGGEPADLPEAPEKKGQ